MTTTTELTTCPECSQPLRVGADVLPTEIITCSDCATELEVLAIGPLVLAVAPPVEEDWGE